MADNDWNADRFGSELKAKLLTVLAGVRDTSALTAAVTECSAAAETVCCGRMMACAAGCPHCCVLNVAILLPEGIVIADWMRERFLPSELSAVRKRLSVHRSWARWMDDDERIIKRMTCPLLSEAGHCLIHPVRPMACRAVTSLDSDSCREALSPIITDEVRLVRTDLLRQAAFDTVFTTLAESLRSYGLNGRSIELGCGVLAFLEHPEYRELFLCGGKLPEEIWL